MRGNPRKEWKEVITGVDDVSMSGDVGEGLRAVLFYPRSGFGVGWGAGCDDVFALVVAWFEGVVGVVVVVDVHNRDRLRHCEHGL